MGAHVWLPGLRQIQPPAAPADHRLDAGLVRRLSGPDLLLPRPDRRHRPAVVRHPLQHRLQADHGPGAADPAGRGLGVRAAGPVPLSRPGLPGRWPPCRSSSAGSSPSTAATSPRPWRASSASRSACRWPWCSLAWSPGASRPAGIGPWPRCCWLPSGICHILPLFFAIGGAIVLTLMRFDRRRLQWTLPVLVVGAALIAFWALPFYVRLPYATNMGYQKLTDYLGSLFPSGDTWLFVLAGAGAVLALARRNRVGNFLTIMAVLCARGVPGSPPGPAVERPGAAVLVPLPVPAGRGGVHGGRHPARRAPALARSCAGAP